MSPDLFLPHLQCDVEFLTLLFEDRGSELARCGSVTLTHRLRDECLIMQTLAGSAQHGCDTACRLQRGLQGRLNTSCAEPPWNKDTPI